MSARIAPEPVKAGFSTVGDYRPRTLSGDARQVYERPSHPAQQAFPVGEEPPLYVTPPPLPAAPPGAAFAVALLSGQLAPRPTSEREIMLRLGSADLPAQGSLALHDRRV